MSSDDDFDAVAYKEFEDQLYEERSLSGLVWKPHVFLSHESCPCKHVECPAKVIVVPEIIVL